MPVPTTPAASLGFKQYFSNNGLPNPRVASIVAYERGIDMAGIEVRLTLPLRGLLGPPPPLLRPPAGPADPWAPYRRRRCWRASRAPAPLKT